MTSDTRVHVVQCTIVVFVRKEKLSASILAAQMMNPN